MADEKQFPLKFDPVEHQQLTDAAAKRGLSMQQYAKRAVMSAILQDQALEYAAECLEIYGEAFGMAPEGVAEKAAELRSAGDRLAA